MADLRQQVTIGAIDGIDVDVLVQFLEGAFEVQCVRGNGANGIPPHMIVLEPKESP